MTVYNIVLNAENKVSGGTNASCLYNFDWGILPRGEIGRASCRERV